MSPHKPIILIDTMAVIGAKRSQCWPAVAERHHLASGEEVAREAQAGDRYVAGYVELTSDDLRRIRDLHSAEATSLDALRIDPRLAAIEVLDGGELELIAIAVRWVTEGNTNWMMCTHDKAAIRAMIALDLGDHLVSLERLVDDRGKKASPQLSSHLQERWLSAVKTEAILANAGF